MHHGDFYHGEKSMTLDKARDVKMELITKSGKTIVLKPKVSLQDREVIDSMFMSKKALVDFYEKADRGRAQDRRDVLAARQGDDDEGLAPHRLRPLRAHLLQGRVRQARQAVRRAGREREQRHGRSVQQDRHAAAERSATRSSATCTPATSTAPSWPWSTPARASPTSTCPTT
jgi:hypothetical protein